MPAFLIALAVAIAATPIARVVAIKLGVLDHPSDRKVQREPVPYLGGAAVLVAWLAGGGYRLGWQPLVAAGLLAVMGLVDDVRGVSGLVKFIAIMPCAIFMWTSGLRVSVTDIPAVDLVLTLGWYAGITNAVNFLDNMDGLASGVVAIAAGTLAILGTGAPAAALAGAMLGFLLYNRAPARIYLGDFGANPAGLLLGVLATQTQASRGGFLAGLVACGVPVADTLMISASRVSRRLSPLTPGRDHFSHRLERIGLSRHAAVGVLWAAGVVCATLAAIMSLSALWTGLIAYVVLAGVASVLALRVPAS